MACMQLTATMGSWFETWEVKSCHRWPVLSADNSMLIQIGGNIKLRKFQLSSALNTRIKFPSCCCIKITNSNEEEGVSFCYFLLCFCKASLARHMFHRLHRNKHTVCLDWFLLFEIQSSCLFLSVQIITTVRVNNVFWGRVDKPERTASSETISWQACW